MKTIIKFLIILNIFIFICPVFAQDDSQLEDEVEKAFEEIIEEEFKWLREESETTVVGVARYEQRLMDAPAMVSVVELSDLSRLTKTNIPELLRTIPGLTVYRNHGDNPWYRVSTRGLNDNFFSARTLVTIDGAPFFNPHGGGVDLSWLPLANIERIEVINGTFSTLYGANAFGGMINIITRKGPDDENSRTEVGMQITGRENIDKPSREGIAASGLASHSGYTSFLSYHLSADILTDNGYRQNWQVTPSFMGDPSRIDVFSNDLKQNRSRFSWHAATPSGFSFSGFYTKDDKDVLGINDGLDDGILHSALSFARTVNSQYDFLVRFYYNRFEQFMDATETFRFAEDTPFPGAHLISQPFFYDLCAFTTGGEFQNRLNLSDTLRLVFGTDFRYDGADLEVRYRESDGIVRSFGYTDENVQDYGAYVQAEYLWMDKFSITPGLRYDYDSKAGSFVSGKLGMLYHLSDAHSLYGVAGRGFRVPNFNERFVVFFGKTGNKDLEPEKTWQFELGTKDRFFGKKVSGELFAFYTIADDYIDTNEDDIYINTEGVTVWGTETDWAWQITSQLRASAALTIIIGEDDHTGQDIPFVPRHKWCMGLSYDDHAQWSADLQIRGEAHRTLGEAGDNRIRADSYQVADVSISRKWVIDRKDFTITLFADNLFDKRYVDAWPGTISTEGGRSSGLALGLRAYINF